MIHRQSATIRYLPAYRPGEGKFRSLNLSPNPPANYSGLTAQAIALFLIDLAKRQLPGAEIRKSAILSDLNGLDVPRLTNLFLRRNPYHFSSQNFSLDANQSFIGNAQSILDIMKAQAEEGAQQTSAKPAISGKVIEKTIHGHALRFLSKGPWKEADLAAVKAHLHLTPDQAASFARVSSDLNLVLVSTKTTPGKVRKLRNGKTQTADNRVDVVFAIYRPGWRSPSATGLAFRSLGLALLWPLTCFAYRPSLAWPKGEVQQRFSYRTKAGE